MRKFTLLLVLGCAPSVWADGVGILNRATAPYMMQLYGSTAPSGVFFNPIDQSAAGGVRIAIGDVNGDTKDDIIVGPGQNGMPRVTVYTGANYKTESFFAFDPNFFNANIALLPVAPDHPAQLAAGSRAGLPNQVIVVDAATGTLVREFAPFEATFTGGVNVAYGDVSGDGIADIVASQQTGGPQVRVFDGVTGFQIANFNTSFPNGVSVAVGDFNNDNVQDLATAPLGGPGQVVVLNRAQPNVILQSFFAFNSSFAGGVCVAASDHNRDGTDDLVCSVFSSGGPQVRVRDFKNNADLANFFAYTPSYTGGVIVAGSQDPLPRTTVNFPLIPSSDTTAARPCTIDVLTPEGIPVGHMVKPSVLLPSTVSGSFSFVGVCDVVIKPKGCLARKVRLNLNRTTLNPAALTFLLGDIDGDNAITVFDYSILSDAFGKTSADSDWNTDMGGGFAPVDADLDGDGEVSVFDYSPLSDNFDKSGD